MLLPHLHRLSSFSQLSLQCILLLLQARDTLGLEAQPVLQAVAFGLGLLQEFTCNTFKYR